VTPPAPDVPAISDDAENGQDVLHWVPLQTAQGFTVLRAL
jgi:hypothetical protein